MKKPLFISVRGTRHMWVFEIMGDPKDVKEMQADGLLVYDAENAAMIPAVIAESGFGRIWLFFQDVFNFRWRK